MFALAAGAHVLAGGSLPGPAIFAGLVALVLAPVMILAKIRITAPVMAGLLGAGELVLHEAFNALSVSAGFTPVPGGHLHGTGPVPPSAGALMPEHAAAPGALMLILHAAATLATALALARGEAAVWALAAWLKTPGPDPDGRGHSGLAAPSSPAPHCRSFPVEKPQAARPARAAARSARSLSGT